MYLDNYNPHKTSATDAKADRGSGDQLAHNYKDFGNGRQGSGDQSAHNYEDFGNGRRCVALMSWEAGGSNCLEPLVIGAETGLPIADCDLMGRAFPELQVIFRQLNN